MQGTTPEINDINITVSGVEKLLSKLNPTKVAGPDNIAPRVVKELAPFVSCLASCSGWRILPLICLSFWRKHSETGY
jgi:hypothetical protein